MKVTGTEDNSEAKPLAKSRGTLTVKWAGSRDKIFSPSGRGRTFFLTSLFIERFDGGSVSVTAISRAQRGYAAHYGLSAQSKSFRNNNHATQYKAPFTDTKSSTMNICSNRLAFSVAIKPIDPLQHLVSAPISAGRKNLKYKNQKKYFVVRYFLGVTFRPCVSAILLGDPDC